MIIGITGIIGTGKSIASDYLANKTNAKHISVDNVGNLLLDPESPVFKKILKAFGTTDRAKLRQIVFNAPDKLTELEAIMHPEMVKSVTTAVNYLKSQNNGCILDAAVLHRMGLDKICDKVIVLKSSIERIRDRIQSRDLSKDDIDAILKSVPDIPEQDAIVIENDGSKEEFLN